MYNKPLLIAEGTFRGLNLAIFQGSCLQIPPQQTELMTIDLSKATMINAANEKLEHMGGIARQIVSMGGDIIQSESFECIRHKKKLNTGDVCTTTAGSLPYRNIVHAVGPRIENKFVSEHDINKLNSTLYNAMTESNDLGAETMICPIISSGIFNFPKDKAALCHLEAFLIFAQQRSPSSSLKNIVYSCFQQEELDCMLDKLMNTYKDRNFKDNVFSYFRYYGTHQEQGMSFHKSFCQVCKISVDKDRCNVCPGKHLCDFCAFQNAFAACPICNHPLVNLDYSYIICRYCGSASNIDYHHCRTICANCIRTMHQPGGILEGTGKCVCGIQL